MISLTALAIILGLFAFVGLRQGSSGIAVAIALLGFLVVGVSAGILPGLGVTAGINGEETQLSIESDTEVSEARDGIVVGRCVWDRDRVVNGQPARPAAVFELANESDDPKRVRVEVIFGNARSPVQDGQPIFTEVHPWTAAPSDDEHWLVPPRVPPRLAEPNVSGQPANPIALTAPDASLDAAITWCGVRIADVRGA